MAVVLRKVWTGILTVGRSWLLYTGLTSSEGGLENEAHGSKITSVRRADLWSRQFGYNEVPTIIVN